MNRARMPRRRAAARVLTLAVTLAAAGLPLGAVVTSPLRRCLQTLGLALPGTQPVVDERFTECGYGSWTGQPLRQLAKDPLWSVVQAHPSAVAFPGDGGEAMSAMSVRAVAAVRDWDARVTAAHGPDALWLVCSHGDVIKSVVADALGLHLDQFQRITADPASITVIRYTPLRPFVLRLNDTGGDLGGLRPPAKGRRRPSTRAAQRGNGRRPGTTGRSDAPVGGGAG